MNARDTSYFLPCFPEFVADHAPQHAHNWDFDPDLQLADDSRPSSSVNEVRLVALANDLAALRGRVKLWLDRHGPTLPPAMVDELRALVEQSA